MSHVGAQPDVVVRCADTQRADHARAPESAMHLVAPTLQPFGHQIGRGVFFIGELGIRMDLPSDGDHLVFVLANLVECGQGQRGVHVREEHRRAHDVGERQAGGRQQRAQVVHGLDIRGPARRRRHRRMLLASARLASTGPASGDASPTTFSTSVAIATSNS